MSRRATLVLALLAAVSARAMQPGEDFGPVVQSGALFGAGFREIEALRGERYTVVEEGVRYRLPQPNFVLGGLRVGETLFRLRDGKVDDVQFSLYNRGDDGPLDDAAFTERLKAAAEALTSLSGAQRTPANRKSNPALSTFDIGGFLWKGQTCQWLLEYSVATRGVRTVPVPEYIRLTALPPGASAAPAASGAGNRVRVNPRRNVVRSPDGGCEIQGIPMVDQGAKGYCAAATTARVMAYYGYEQLDQHQIAQWAQTDSEAGTSSEAMMKGISRVLHDTYRLNVRSLEPAFDIKDLKKLLERYNRSAKRLGRPEVPFPPPGSTVNLNELWASFDIEALRNAKVPNQQAATQWFQQKIKPSIDAGIPVLWSVQLGLVPEVPALPQASGGHMRLITGYGPGGKTLVYSDSWGAGHERKTMPVEDAIAITLGLKTIAPTLN